MLWSDARFQWDGTVMPDPRVVHLWDGDRIIGMWFAEHIEGFDGVAWDAYYLYGPDQTWDTTAPRPMGSGSTVYSARDLLRSQVVSLLEASDLP